MKKMTVAAMIVLAAGAARAQEFQGEVALSFGKAPFLSTDDDDERLSEPATSFPDGPAQASATGRFSAT